MDSPSIHQQETVRKCGGWEVFPLHSTRSQSLTLSLAGPFVGTPS
jgi:hypothetical protein